MVFFGDFKIEFSLFLDKISPKIREFVAQYYFFQNIFRKMAKKIPPKESSVLHHLIKVLEQTFLSFGQNFATWNKIKIWCNSHREFL